MPELPEMETYRTLLTPLIMNQKISNVEIQREKSVNLPADHFIDVLTNNQITRIERRAKMLLFYGPQDGVLLLHLMLGGWMFYGTEQQKPKRTVQVKINFAQGPYSLYFIGLRLGYLHWLQQAELSEKLKSIGPEPLSPVFTLPYFQSRAEKRRGNIKSALIDQQWIAGIGNGYADEILYHAGLLPMRQFNELSSQEIGQLYYSIQSTLHQAIQHGGYMDQPLHVDDHKTGGYNKMFRVHSRQHESCVRCGEPIKMQMMGTRKTYFCTQCQN